jgi:hypothetical protein
MSRVLNLNAEPLGDAVYIGRRSARRGLAGSDFANPYQIPRDGTRVQVIEQYRRWLSKQPNLLRRLRELRGHRLACYCRPLPCHGDVLSEFVDADELLEQLAAAGITAVAREGMIRLSPAAKITKAVSDRVRPLKQAILPLLTLRQAEQIPAEEHPLVAHAAKIFNARITKIVPPARQLA